MYVHILTSKFETQWLGRWTLEPSVIWQGFNKLDLFCDENGTVKKKDWLLKQNIVMLSLCYRLKCCHISSATTSIQESQELSYRQY